MSEMERVEATVRVVLPASLAYPQRLIRIAVALLWGGAEVTYRRIGRP